MLVIRLSLGIIDVKPEFEMKKNNILLSLVLIITIFCITGCNVFESLDRSIDKRDFETLVEHGNYKLAAAEYADALDLFERAAESGYTDDIYRGLAASNAGLAGFNMFEVINALQNGIIDSNTSAVFFDASKKITDINEIHLAINYMNLIKEVGNDDLLLRSLLAVVADAKNLYLKYDTYKNNRLDSSDHISITADESEYGTWSELYSKFSSPSDFCSLEKSYNELVKALSGRGISKTAMSPFGDVIQTADLTEANFKIILAVENFANKLKAANGAYERQNEEQFRRYIESLDDGASL